MVGRNSRRTFLKGLVAGAGLTAVTSGSALGQTDLRTITYGETRLGKVDANDPRYPFTDVPAEPVEFECEAGDEILLEAVNRELGGLFYGVESPGEEMVFEHGAELGTGGWIGYASAQLHTGTYTVWIAPYPEITYGTYELSLRRTGSNHLLEPGQVTTEELSPGDTNFESIDTASGSLSTPSYIDHYRMSGSAGQTVRLTVESSDFVPRLFVSPRYRDGYTVDVVDGDDDIPAGKAELTHTFAEDGNLEIGVTATERDLTGRYVISTAEVGGGDGRDIEVALVYLRPPFPNPGQHFSVVAVVRTPVDGHELLRCTLYVDDDRAGESTVEPSAGGATTVEFTSEEPLDPGDHTVRVVVESGSGSPERTLSVTVPRLVLEEFYTRYSPPKLEPGELVLSAGSTRTHVELENPSGEDVSVDLTLTVRPSRSGDSESIVRTASGVDLPKGAAVRVPFAWVSVPGERHDLALEVDIHDGVTHLLETEYERPATPSTETVDSLPTVVAYSETTGSGLGYENGQVVIEPEFWSPWDVSLSKDPETGDVNSLWVPLRGSGDVEVTVLQPSWSGKSPVALHGRANVNTRIDTNMPTVVEVPVDVPPDWDFAVIVVEADVDTLEAVYPVLNPGNLVFELRNVATVIEAILSSGSLPDKQFGASFTYVLVAELSGYPQSDDMEYVKEWVKDHFAWRSVQDALTDIATTLVGESLQDDTKALALEVLTESWEIVDAVEEAGTSIVASALDFFNPDSGGDVSVYEYDAPPRRVDETAPEDATPLKYVNVTATGVRSADATITVHYSEDEVTGSEITEDSLELYHWEGDQWVQMADTEILSDDRMVRATIPLAERPETIVLLSGK